MQKQSKIITISSMTENTIAVGAIKTFYESFGKGETKIVILHGWDPTKVVRESYHEIAPLMAQELKCEVIVPDLPGFGNSDNPPFEGWDTHDYEKWLEGFLKELGNEKNIVLYGHSFGCRIIVRYLLKHPKFAGKIILTGAAGIRWPLSFKQTVSMSLAKNVKMAKHLMPQRVQKYVVTKIFGAKDWGCVPPHMKHSLKKVLDEPDFREELPKINNKVLLIWGSDDAITPLRSARVYEEKLPNGELHILPTGRHGIHKTHPKEIVKIIKKFL